MQIVSTPGAADGGGTTAQVQGGDGARTTGEGSAPQSKASAEPLSVGEVFFDSISRGGDAVAMRRRDVSRWEDISCSELGRRVEALGAALIRRGIVAGDRVAVIANSRVEWAIADLATLAIGAVTVPVYQSSLPGDVRYVLEHSGARLVFCEDREQLAKVLEVRADLPRLENIALIDGKVQSEGFVLAYDKLLDSGALALKEEPAVVRDRTSQVRPDSVATLVYTSGTTGPPKGVVLTHGNILFEIDALSKVVPLGRGDETLLFLPMAHIFARLGYMLSLTTGFTVSYARSFERLMDDLQEIQPTFIFSVPRIYEKIYGAVTAGVQRGTRLKKQIFAFAMWAGRSVSGRLQQGQRIPFYLSLLYQMAEILVFNKLRRVFGGSLRFCISGGAPLSKEMAEFFHAAGILILEGYGLTENAAAVSLNRLEKFRFGSVGLPLPGCEVRIADDGEILLRGPNIFQGYYERPDATAEALVHGWFHTGDIGELDADGILRITDRKKDLIVTSGGKNIAPQNIENHMKSVPLISQIMVYGDKRNYLTALVTLDQGELQSFAQRRDIPYEKLEELSSHPDVYAKLRRDIEVRNRDLASFETIKKFAILSRELEIGEELTPTLKVKRKAVTQKYWEILDGLYGGDGTAGDRGPGAGGAS